MKTALALPKVAIAVVAVSMAACSMDIDRDVDVRETGLPGYPGARLIQDSDGAESARISIDTSLFGLGVVAAEFETGDDVESVLAFYRQAMQQYGAVTECRGDIQFKDDRAVCDPEPTSDEVELVSGTEGDQRIVAVKPRAEGAEFAIVHVRTRAD